MTDPAPSDPLQDPLIAGLRGHRRRFRAGSFIIFAGDEATSLFLLLSGSVVVMVQDESGDETVLIHQFPGDFFGEICLCPDFTERTASVIARDDVEVYEIDYAEFKAAAQNSPELWMRIIKQLSGRLHEVTERVRILARCNATQRIAVILKQLSAQPDAQNTPSGCRLQVTRQELANMAGCTREMVSRSLQELARAGFIELPGRDILVTPLLNG